MELKKLVVSSAMVACLVGNGIQAIDGVTATLTVGGIAAAAKITHMAWGMERNDPKTAAELAKERKALGSSDNFVSEFINGHNQNEQYATTIEYTKVTGIDPKTGSFLDQNGNPVTVEMAKKSLPPCPPAGWGKINKFVLKHGANALKAAFWAVAIFEGSRVVYRNFNSLPCPPCDNDENMANRIAGTIAAQRARPASKALAARVQQELAGSHEAIRPLIKRNLVNNGINIPDADPLWRTPSLERSAAAHSSPERALGHLQGALKWVRAHFVSA
ncbi:MAG TPA: hypothetical protein VLG71_01860 [Candidatus Limnocylindria bacterium]|nr:hypothetical protein [Candidatus Limnocylindria bacterium]